MIYKKSSTALTGKTILGRIRQWYQLYLKMKRSPAFHCIENAYWIRSGFGGRVLLSPAPFLHGEYRHGTSGRYYREPGDLQAVLRGVSDIQA
jgi:hypothetical protein